MKFLDFLNKEEKKEMLKSTCINGVIVFVFCVGGGLAVSWVGGFTWFSSVLGFTTAVIIAFVESACYSILDRQKIIIKNIKKLQQQDLKRRLNGLER